MGIDGSQKKLFGFALHLDLFLGKVFDIYGLKKKVRQKDSVVPVGGGGYLCVYVYS